MRRPARRVSRVLSAGSLVLCVATAAGWVAGALRPTAWAARARPERTWFVRVEPMHLVVSDQQAVPQLLPPGYSIDTTRFREYWLSGPRLPGGQIGLEINAENWMVRPPGPGFRSVRTGCGGFK